MNWSWSSPDQLPHTEDDLERWYGEQAPWSWLGGPRRRTEEDIRRIKAMRKIGERCRT